MKFTSDIEILEYNTKEEIQKEIERFTLALEQKAQWDKLSKDQKEAEFDKIGYALLPYYTDR